MNPNQANKDLKVLMATVWQQRLAIIGLVLCLGLSLLIMFNMDLSVIAMIGIVMLVGIVKKNAIMMIDFALQRREVGLGAEEAIREACLLRFRPILMTTVAAILGGFALMFSHGAGGSGQHRRGQCQVDRGKRQQALLRRGVPPGRGAAGFGHAQKGDRPRHLLSGLWFLALVGEVQGELFQARVDGDHLRTSSLLVSGLVVGAFARRYPLEVIAHAQIMTKPFLLFPPGSLSYH